MRQRLLILPILLLLYVPLHAQVTLALPLEGYFRAGSYMPVEVSSGSPIEIRGRGMLTTRISGARDAAIIAPLLVLDDDIDSAHFTQPLRRLGENERLVGFVGTLRRQNVAQELFPKKSVISISLAQWTALKGPAIAWETLDAIVVDGAWPAHLREDFVSILLGAGVTFALRAPDKPDAKFPWTRQGEWWVLRYEPLGPVSSIAPSAYAPVAGWVPGETAEVRSYIVSTGILLSIVALGMTLLPRRVVLPSLLGLTIIACGAIAWWSARQPVEQVQWGRVVAPGARLVQDDYWTYAGGLREGRCFHEGHRATRPVFVSADQAERLGMELQIKDEGTIEGFSIELKPGARIAFLDRYIYPNERIWQPDQSRQQSPLRQLVREAYVTPPVRIIGESDASSGWPTVFIERFTP